MPVTDQYELALQDIYLREAVRFMKYNPDRVIIMGLRKTMYYWGINFTYPGAQSPLYWLPWFIVFPFFIVGMVQSFRAPNRYFLFYVYFVISTLIIMTFFVIPRYRLFILPLVFPFAVSGCITVLQKITIFSSTYDTQ